MPKRSARERREVERRLLERRRHPPKVSESLVAEREPDPKVTRWALIFLSSVLGMIVMTALLGVTLFAAPLDQSFCFMMFSGVLTVTVIAHVLSGQIRGRNNSPGVSRSTEPLQFWAVLTFHMLLVALLEWIYVQNVLFPPNLGS